MFGKKKEKQKDESFVFVSDNYKMQDNYETSNLVVANLEYISNCGPMVITTDQKYIFEKLIGNSKVRYREVFTGLIVEAEENHYFNLPYVVNIVPLNDLNLSLVNNIPKYSLLLLLNDINNIKEDQKRRVKK